MSDLDPCRICGQLRGWHDRPHLFEDESLLSLSEIEARLTPDVMEEAAKAGRRALHLAFYADQAAPRKELDDAYYRAWRAVILAALGKDA
jgi:hypothetical protein